MLNSTETTETREPLSEAAEAAADSLRDLSIIRVGPLYRVGTGWLQRPARASRPDRRTDRLGPSVVLSALQNVLMNGPAVPFYGSLGTHARLLLAIPLMFVAEVWFDERTRALLGEFVRGGIIPVADHSRFVDALRRAIGLADSWVVEGALVILTVTLIISGLARTCPRLCRPGGT